MGFLSKVLSVSIATLAVANAGEIISFGNTKDVIPGSYIVVMNDGVSDKEFNTHRNWASGVHASSVSRRSESGMGRTFNVHGWKGYSGQFDETTVKGIANNTAVCFNYFQ